MYVFCSVCENAGKFQGCGLIFKSRCVAFKVFDQDQLCRLKPVHHHLSSGGLTRHQRIHREYCGFISYSESSRNRLTPTNRYLHICSEHSVRLPQHPQHFPEFCHALCDWLNFVAFDVVDHTSVPSLDAKQLSIGKYENCARQKGIMAHSLTRSWHCAHPRIDNMKAHHASHARRIGKPIPGSKLSKGSGYPATAYAASQVSPNSATSPVGFPAMPGQGQAFPQPSYSQGTDGVSVVSPTSPRFQQIRPALPETQQQPFPSPPSQSAALSGGNPGYAQGIPRAGRLPMGTAPAGMAQTGGFGGYGAYPTCPQGGVVQDGAYGMYARAK